ncbi:MAG TPA: hypothetical protein VGN14_01285, partial [Candidatus Elarobacter sp.]
MPLSTFTWIDCVAYETYAARRAADDDVFCGTRMTIETGTRATALAPAGAALPTGAEPQPQRTHEISTGPNVRRKSMGTGSTLRHRFLRRPRFWFGEVRILIEI